MKPVTPPNSPTGAIKVYVLPSIAGKVKWRDYIPVVYR